MNLEDENMQIQVNLFATFKVIAGQKSFTLEIPDEASIFDAVSVILKKFPALKPHWLDQKGELRAHVHIFLNSDDISTLPLKIHSKLSSNDMLDFIPPVAGG
jgi:MoaD family protein